MSLLHRKLLRDLLHMKGQYLAIAILIALAIGTFVGATSTHRSLQHSRDSYYDKYFFGHVFAQLARAPDTLAPRLFDIEGVQQIQMRIAYPGLIRLPTFDEPVSGRFVGLPDSGLPTLGRIHIRKGRLPEAGQSREVVISEAFAIAQQLKPGDALSAVINGKKLKLQVCGIGLSPEHVYEVRPGDMFPDNQRFAILWLRESALREALGMAHSFNELVLQTYPSANEQEIINRLDAILRPYGGTGSYTREHHVSARFISEELKQLTGTAFFVPSIFLAVAIFLLSIIVGRVVTTQREQIATLKAIGYTNLTIAFHYVQLSLVIVSIGSILGLGVGYVFGQTMMRMYADYYRFATFHYQLSILDIVPSILFCLIAGIIGTSNAVRRAVSLQPADAMRPAAPTQYRRSFLEHLGFGLFLGPVGRMILRNLSRHPFRALSSTIGISLAVALLVTGLFFNDSMSFIMDSQFRRSQRQDLSLVFNHPVSKDALLELKNLPGVTMVEPKRSVAAIIRRGHRSYRSEISGIQPKGQLQRVLSLSADLLDVPTHGIMLSETLANNIQAKIGDSLQLELMEGDRKVVNATVTAIADEPFGTSAYASIETANDLAGTGPQITSALLRIDQRYQTELFSHLEAMPGITTITNRKAMLRSFDVMTSGVILFFAAALSTFASAMAVGVVYNAARVSLSERERELATMRVIGMTHREVSFVLLGELFGLVLLALPLGCLLGYVFAHASAAASSTDMYRIPVIISPRTYLFSMLIVLASTSLVSLVVRKRLNNLDLVSVLKTKE